MDKKNIIVIGASAGGFEAIRKIVSGLAPNLDAAIFIVWHMSPDVKGILPEVLNKLGTLKASHPADREQIRFGHVYVAPPDHHMLIEKDRIRVTRGPKENRFRPAVDPLFRSAAYAYGSRVVGVILTGALDDGTAGLWTIKQCGGTAVVQDPKDSEVSSMPEHAIRAVKVNHILPVAEMSGLLNTLANEDALQFEGNHVDIDRIINEIKIAMEDQTISYDIMRSGELTPYTCPECHGVLTALAEGGRLRFRCHTGHAFSADSLLSALTENIEESLWTAIRSVQESVILLNHMGDHFAEVNQPKVAAMYFKKAKEAEGRVQLVRQAVTRHEQLSTASIEMDADDDTDT